MIKAILVDDEIIALNALWRRVDWREYGIGEALTATSMREAQEVFRATAPQLMLCDIEMPGGRRAGTVRVGQGALPRNRMHLYHLPSGLRAYAPRADAGQLRLYPQAHRF